MVYTLTFFSNKSHLDVLGLVVQPVKITLDFDPASPLPSFPTSVYVIIVPSVSSFEPTMKMLNRIRQRIESPVSSLGENPLG